MTVKNKLETVLIKKEHVFVVRESKKSGQKTIGIPNDTNLETGDEVQILKIVKGGDKLKK